MIDEGVVRTLAHAGCTSLFLGVEAAAPETLAGLGRKSRPGDAAAAARLARKYGMRLVASFMIGAPGESRESILRTIDLARRINPDKALFNIVQPHPGTRLYQDALAQGIIDEYEVDYGRFPGPPHGVPTVCGGLARGELQALSRRAHRAFYGGPRFIMSQLARCRRPRDLARLAALVKRSVVRPTSGSGPLSTPR